MRVEFLSSTYVPIPEPSSAGLLAVGLIALLRRRR
ncbi:MAG: PEP-CTERM sorting domain-containing protein [Verrucomicrobiales bacterium]